MTTQLVALRVRLFRLWLGARGWERTARATTDEAGVTRPIGHAEDRPAFVTAPEPRDLVSAAYETFQREIHSFALHSTRDPDVAADVTHEAFLKLLREARDNRAPDNVRAWLYRVAANMIMNRARHQRVADGARRFWHGGEESQESPEWLALRAEATAALRLALADLPRDARVGLLLAANGFSGREIAEAIGRSELATRTLLCRARAELRRRLAPEAAT